MTTALDLYELLPVVHRERDAVKGGPLEALLTVITEQARHVQGSIAALWDDFFIETCDEWVIPYIADLIGTDPLHDIDGRNRADIAKTIYYRRRKGTLAQLEEMARDVTGWGAHAVGYFELLGWAQHLAHLRREPTAGDVYGSTRVGTVNLRDVDAADRIDGAFDVVTHTADVRTFRGRVGRHNIPNVGFHLWRLQHFPLCGVRARRLQDGFGYAFDSLGVPAPIFTNPERELAAAGLAGEEHVPAPIRPFALHTDLEAARAGRPSRYYGTEGHHSLSVSADGEPVPAAAVTVCDLTDWARPEGATVAVDPRLGRLAFAEGAEPADQDAVTVDYHYGFSGPIGGGAYDRRATLTPVEPGDFYGLVSRNAAVRAAVEARFVDAPDVAAFPTVQSALAGWGAQERAVVEILDNDRFGGVLDIELPAGRSLELRAANKVAPVLRPQGALRLSSDGGARVRLDGLRIAQQVVVQPGIVRLEVAHCTLVPGLNLAAGEGEEAGTIVAVPTNPSAASIVSAGGAAAAIEVTGSIAGGIRVAEEGFRLSIADSIVDAPDRGVAVGGVADAPGPACRLETVTVLGKVRVRQIDYAADALFVGEVRSQRTQTGCIRYSYVPAGSVTPPWYRCQPDLALDDVTDAAARQRVIARLRPEFTSEHYGDPAYGQLAAGTAPELRAGAEYDLEMGAFNLLKQPLREANLLIRLEEYLPFGLEPGLIYET